MLIVVTLFTVQRPAAEDDFVGTIREGSWKRLARNVVPDFLGTTLLRHQKGAPRRLFLCLDFWTSFDACSRAFRSREVQNFFDVRRQLAVSCLELGAFAFTLAPDFGPSPRLSVH